MVARELPTTIPTKKTIKDSILFGIYYPLTFSLLRNGPPPYTPTVYRDVMLSLYFNYYEALAAGDWQLATGDW